MRTLSLFGGILICILLIINACNTNGSHPTLLQAEKLMNEHPDSALLLLEDSTFATTLSGKAHADWCVLLTQARDKNYIPHTSDSLIRIACEYYESHPDPERLMLTYYYMGRVSQDLGDALQAQNYYLKALDTGILSENRALKARICSNLGNLYIMQGATEEAVVHLQNGLEHLRQLGDSVSQAYLFRDIARIHWSKNRLDSAAYYYKQAERVSDQSILPSIYSELGSVLSDSSQFNEAKFYLQKSIQTKKNPIYHFTTYLSIGKLYRLMGQSDSARFYLHQSMESTSIETKAGAYYHLSQLAKKEKDWLAYVSLQEQYEMLLDSFESQTYTSNIQRMQSLYNYKLKENENQQLKLQSDIKLRNYFILFLVLLLFASIVIYFIWRRKQELVEQEKRLKQLVEIHKLETEKEIEDNLTQIRDMDKEIANTLGNKKKILQLKKKYLELNNEKIDLDKDMLKHKLELQNLREERFKRSDIYLQMTDRTKSHSKEEKQTYIKELAKVYPDLIPTIRQYYPTINQEKIELCYFTKIELGNEAMGSLLSCSRNTVCSKKERFYEKIFVRKGSTAQFNDFIKSI